jgi:hypothetical protein
MISIVEQLADLDEDILLADGFEDALVGYSYVDGYTRAVYDAEKMIEIAGGNGDMTREEATEYLEFNCWSAYVGPNGPIYLHTFEEEYYE